MGKIIITHRQYRTVGVPSVWHIGTPDDYNADTNAVFAQYELTLPDNAEIGQTVVGAPAIFVDGHYAHIIWKHPNAVELQNGQNRNGITAKIKKIN